MEAVWGLMGSNEGCMGASGCCMGANGDYLGANGGCIWPIGGFKGANEGYLVLVRASGGW